MGWREIEIPRCNRGERDGTRWELTAERRPAAVRSEEAWRQGGEEAWRQGGEEAWWQGGEEAWRQGGEEACGRGKR